MRFSVTLALFGMFMTGSLVLATPEVSDDYSLEARTVDTESLHSRNVYDTYMDIGERDLFDDDLEEFYAREYFDQELLERDSFQDLIDYVTREENEGALQARYDLEDLEERQFSDDEAEFERRMDDMDGIELKAREPLRYRIGIVVQPQYD